MAATASLCFLLASSSFSGRLLRSLGLLTFLLLSALCLFFPLSSRLFFLLSSCLLSLFGVPGGHFFHRGQDSFVRSILLKPAQGSVIQFEPDSAFFHELGDPVRRDAILNQIANVIEGKNLLRLSERWQRVNNQEKYRQNGTTVRRTNGSRKTSITFQTARCDGML